ncbi:MAG: ANTAR domain-containing protein [Clostridiales bacterium]
MNPFKILLCLSNDNILSKVRNILSSNKYIITDYAKDGQECLKKTKVIKPDIILLEYNINIMNGVELSKILLKDKISEVLLMISEENISKIEELKSRDTFTYMVKPINKYVLISFIESIVKKNKRVKSLEAEIKELKNSLMARKEIEKAKGLLMKNLNLTEPEAFKKIQKQSMDKGLPMMDIAKAIIIAYDI